MGHALYSQRVWFTRLAACGLAAFFLFGSTVRAQQLIPIEGAPFAAKLQSADPRWNLAFTHAKGAVERMPAADLLRWGDFADPVEGVVLVLADGGQLLAAELLALDGEYLKVDTNFAPVKLPLKSLAGIVLRSPTDRAARETLIEGLLTANDKQDSVLLTNGDELLGGVVGLSATQLEMQAGEAPLKIDRSRLAAITFSKFLRATPKVPGVSAWIGLADGSRIWASSLVADAKQARLTLASGGELLVPLAEIVALQPVGGRAVYLSDLASSGYKHIPYLQTAWPFRNDRAVTGGELRGGGQRYLKGLGMHSAARLTYDLNESFRAFEATLAIDDSAVDAEGTPRGSIIGRVFTDDGSGQWQLRYESPVIRGGKAAVPVRVDVSGAKRLSLLVDFADRGDELDRANWLDARLLR